ncbi:iron reductase [Salmonella enterica]|nr:iron reductase [Salmonella enterica]EDS8285728.1 iron reductase [Salmonella enterica subsp. enterica]
MKITYFVSSLTLLTASLIFVLSGEIFHAETSKIFWLFQQNFLFFSGCIAWCFMTLAMCLILRSPWLNRILKGLDKSWGLHKQAGIIATVFTLAHWLDEKIPHWLVQNGWLAHPGSLGSVQISSWQSQLIYAGLLAAEWSAYLMVGLVLVSLVKKIPYNIFHFIHRLFPVFYLATAFHIFTVLFKTYWWNSPAGILLVIVSIPGIYAAGLSLFNMIAYKNKRVAIITNIDYYPNDIIEITLHTDTPLLHTPGQFSFLTFQHDAEAHPFTIASYYQDKKHLRFAIKALGDHTHSLKKELKIGQDVIVEGPWGYLDFNIQSERQVWVAGGIGITPFISQLEYLKYSGHPLCPIDLWYCVGQHDDLQYPVNLDLLCTAAGVTLHRIDAGMKLEAKHIMMESDNSQNVHVWFCGPAGFAKSLLSGLQKYGISEKAFHYDRFNMR